MRTGGELVVDCLRAQGVDRVFCVPGESYLPVLAALHGGAIDVVVARQEGGAAMMAEADGKLTGRPGVCLVTRGPGACNAAAGVHVARQDSTPMVLLVGQVGRGMRGREAFQEVDYVRTFADLAKHVEEVDAADRIPEVMARAWATAMGGRPGPVVLALPEDVLTARVEALPGPRVEVPDPAPAPRDVARLEAMLRSAERPMMVLGGSRWRPEDVAAVENLAARWDLPAAVQFRRQHLFDHEHPAYAGDVGLGVNPALRRRIEAADLLILLGGRFGEVPSQGYALPGPSRSGRLVVHVHPGAEEIGRVHAADLAILATPGRLLEAMLPLGGTPDGGRAAQAHAEYLAWSAPPAPRAGPVDMGATIATMGRLLPRDAIVTNGAGNYAGWLHRYRRFRSWGTQLAPTSGSMGYGLPAAVAAALRQPERVVVCLAGDGCFQMTMQELGTAAQARAAIVVVIADNGMYGTIRMHQAREHPGRRIATDIENPDFAALARAYGLFGEMVTGDEAFGSALTRALGWAAEHRKPAVLHLLTDPAAISPTQRLADDAG